jgi:hypothetical protein
MLLFLDESGHDHGEAPYEVLAGVTISESRLWPLIQSIRDAELEHFGVHLRKMNVEFKGKKLLKRKTFRHAGQSPRIDPDKRRDLTRSFLEKGRREKAGATLEALRSEEFAAYGQAVLAFVSRVLALMAQHHVKTFAAIVNKRAIPPADSSMLRRDYAFLFQRFFYYLEDISDKEMGLIVFDELEKSECGLRIHQLERYFLDTNKGYERSSRIVPEPFFVHSDLTTAVQLADIVAYCANWAIRVNQKMVEPIRSELQPFAEQILRMGYHGKRVEPAGGTIEWSQFGIFYVSELRPKHERNPIAK